MILLFFCFFLSTSGCNQEAPLPIFVANITCTSDLDCRAICATGYVTGLEDGEVTTVAFCGDTWSLATPCVPILCGTYPQCVCHQNEGDFVVLCSNCDLIGQCNRAPVMLTLMPAFPKNADIVRFINFNIHHTLPGLLSYPLVHYLALTRAGLTELVAFPNVTMPHLYGLDFSVNSITRVARDYFRNPTFALIDEIVLSRNPLASLSVGIFDNLSLLKHVDLGGTAVVPLLVPFPLIANLSRLTQVKLEWVTLDAVDQWTTLQFVTSATKDFDAAKRAQFASLFDRLLISSSLKELSLIGCNLTTIPQWASLPNLQFLVLDRNDIASLPEASLPSFQGLYNFSMVANPSSCRLDGNGKVSCNVCAPGFGGAPRFCEPQCALPAKPAFAVSNCTRGFLRGSTCNYDGCVAGYDISTVASSMSAALTCQPAPNSSGWTVLPSNVTVVDIAVDLCLPSVCTVCDCVSFSYVVWCTDKNLSTLPYRFDKLPVNITLVFLDNTGLKAVPTFKTRVQNLTCAGNAVTEISAAAFDADFGKYLLDLDLSMNFLSQITPGTFINVPNLLHLDVSGSYLTEIAVGVLRDLPNLQSFECKLEVRGGFFSSAVYNRSLQFLSSLPFDIPHSLEQFDFNNQNQLAYFFESLPVNFFANFKKLTTAKMSGIRFSTSMGRAGVIPPAITAIQTLQELECNACDLERLEAWQAPVNMLRELRINANYVSVVTPSFFGSLPNLRVLHMNLSDFRCILDPRTSAPICGGCDLAKLVAGPGYCTPVCDAVGQFAGARCLPQSVYGATCFATCPLNNVPEPVQCFLNGTSQFVAGTCVPKNGGGGQLTGDGHGIPSAVIIGVAIGALGVLLVVLVASVIVVRRRQQRRASSAVGVTQLETLLVAKVENTFLLAFAGRFKEDELALARMDFARLEVPRKCVRLTRLVGEGQGGEVHLAQMAVSVKDKATLGVDPQLNGATVAVKMQHGRADSSKSQLQELRTGAFDTAAEEALQLEARLLHQLRHTHIVAVVAMVSQSLPTWVCMEYMANGDLKTYLRACRPAVRTPKEFVSEGVIFSVLKQVCEALAYLEDYRVVHRDVAARNVLVGASLAVVKLSDLGATRVLGEGRVWPQPSNATLPTLQSADEQDYYRKRTAAHVPLKWMAPEAVLEARYTVKSDVWAFGVLAYEVTSFAMTPYGALGAQELMTELKSGFRLPQPLACPASLYIIMMQCWQWDPVARPTFVGLLTRLALAVAQPVAVVPPWTDSPTVDPAGYSDRPSAQSHRFSVDNTYVEHPGAPDAFQLQLHVDTAV